MALISKEEIGKRIRDLRSKEGKSQGDLGKYLGKSHAAVSDIELGKTDLSVTDLTKLAQFFDVSVETLISPNNPFSMIFSFSHSRAEIGANEKEKTDILKAREEFRKKARKMQESK